MQFISPSVRKLVTTMDITVFDLVDVQRVRHPKSRKFTYESKAIGMKSRIDFFLLAKNPTKSVKKSIHQLHPTTTQFIRLCFGRVKSRGDPDSGNLITLF